MTAPPAKAHRQFSTQAPRPDRGDVVKACPEPPRVAAPWPCAMATLVQPPTSAHIRSQLTRSLEKLLDEAGQSGELRLSNRKLREFPATGDRYNLRDTVVADLSKNRFNELPDEVTAFHFLERLYCYHNAIRYIPDTIVNLQCLIYVDISRNQLTSLPRELCQLPIKILIVSNNALTHLPDELHRMSSLHELDASCNHLTHLPPRMGELRSIQSLILRNNLLLAVPLDLTLLKLERLDLRANRIGTLPVEMREMKELVELMLEENPLTSPPASLCKRGRVHVFKFLEDEAAKMERRGGGGGTLGRRSRKTTPTTGPALIVDRFKSNKRQNVDSGYSTSSDCFDKRWSQEIEDKSWSSTPLLTRTETNGTQSILSTPSTASPAPELNNDDEGDNGQRLSPGDIDEADRNVKPLHQIQTYKEYKDALRQQRANDGSIYRTKNPDDHHPLHRTEPNTPTHHPRAAPSPTHTSLATSKSDPTPLNAVLTGARYVFDDTKQQRTTPPSSPYKSLNGDSNKNYVKPKSPVRTSGGGILAHDNVPPPVIVNGKSPKGAIGVKGGRSITWNKEQVEKMSFTMRREIDKAREETDLINQLRNIIECRLKMSLPEDLAPALTDGVVLCHLANHIKPRSVASIHVPSPAVPKLTMARCRRNVDNFIEACRKIGVDEGRLCSTLDVTEALVGRGLPRLLDTVTALVTRYHGDDDVKITKTSTIRQTAPPTFQDTVVSLLLLSFFCATVAFFFFFPPPD